MRPSTLIPLLLLHLSVPIWSAEPPGYYAAAQGLSGPALRAALHNIIRHTQSLPYSAPVGTFDTSDALMVLDQAPGDSSRVVLTYSGLTDLKTNFGLSTGWNREHAWPQSFGASSGLPRVDMHAMRAVDSSVNSSRGNLFYDDSDPLATGYASPAHVEAPGTSRDFNSWEPRDSEKGDLARALLYMDLRYEGTNGELDLALTDDLSLITSGGRHMGRLTTLLEWTLLDPVDAAETARMEAVQTLYQGNRNPFIDRPEWITALHGTVLRLTMTVQPGQVTLAWPTGLRRGRLQWSSNLQTWTDSTLSVTTSGTQDMVTLATSGGPFFFRLQIR